MKKENCFEVFNWNLFEKKISNYWEVCLFRHSSDQLWSKNLMIKEGILWNLRYWFEGCPSLKLCLLKTEISKTLEKFLKVSLIEPNFFLRKKWKSFFSSLHQTSQKMEKKENQLISNNKLEVWRIIPCLPFEFPCFKPHLII